jgi:hypothetical protein
MAEERKGFSDGKNVAACVGKASVEEKSEMAGGQTARRLGVHFKTHVSTDSLAAKRHKMRKELRVIFAPSAPFCG